MTKELNAELVARRLLEALEFALTSGDMPEFTRAEEVCAWAAGFAASADSDCLTIEGSWTPELGFQTENTQASHKGKDTESEIEDRARAYAARLCLINLNERETP